MVAEIGINHGGDESVARDMILAAKSSGADVAKFQWYRPLEVLGHDSPYLAEATKCQFSEETHARLKAFCDEIGIEWCCSIFHLDQVDIMERLGMRRYKIASRSARNMPLLYEVARLRKPILLSTGMLELAEIPRILDILAGCDVTLMHCISKYPTRPNEARVERVRVLRDRYGVPVGFSSHCPNPAPTVMAVSAYGACATENHVVFSREQPGCDVSSSITFDELASMAGQIRHIKAAKAILA